MLTINDPSPSPWKIIVTRSLMITVLATISILGSVVPQFERQSSRLSFNSVALAQVNEQQIKKYARAVLRMESYRQQAYNQIRGIIGSNPPEIVCNQPSSYQSLPNEAQQVAREYCQTSEQIVESSGLSVSEFNSITQEAQSNRTLERSIQDAMREMQ